MKHTYTINDGLRTLGQLLLHRGTIIHYAQDKNGGRVDVHDPQAERFCYTGRQAVICKKLHLDFETLRCHARSVSGCEGTCYWDSSSPKEQHKIATKLAMVSFP